MPDFRVVSTHPEDLANGRVAAPGEHVKLSDPQVDDPHNKRLIDDGVLVATEQPKAASGRKEKN